MAPDQLVTIPGSGAAPLSYTIAPAQEIIIKAAFAAFNGTLAASAYRPALRIVAPSGQVVGEYTSDVSIPAGTSCEVSFAPFLGSGSGAAGELDFQLNDVLLAEEPAIDFEDGGGITWQINDDPTNDRAKVSAIVQTGSSTPSVTLSGGVDVENDGNFNGFPGGAKMANGDLIVVYSKSTNEQINAELVFQTSSDDGLTWSGETLLEVPAAGQTLATVGGVTVLANGRVFVTYFPHLNNPGNTGLSVQYIFSDDNGATWSSPATLTPFTSINYPAGAILQLANGTLLMPVGGQDTGDTADKNGVLISTDGGSTWGSVVSVAGTGAAPAFQEMSLFQEPSGTVVALITAQTATDIARATSTTNGATWSITSNLGFSINPALPAAWLQADTQIVFMTYRKAGSFAAVYRYSQDYGVTWSSEATLNTRFYEYAQVFPMSTGLLGIAIGLRHAIGNPSDVVFYTVRITASRATRIIAGSVTAGGGVNHGHGFSIVHTLTGKYDITFDTAFVDVPACVAVPWSTAAFTALVCTTNPAAVGGSAPTAAGFSVWIADTGLVGFRDCGFEFQAILT